MKKISYLIIILSSFLFCNLSQANIRYIDINFILQNSFEGKKIIDELNLIKKKNEELFNSKKKDLDTQQNNLKKIKNITQQEEFQKRVSDLKLKIDEFNVLKENKIISFEKIKKEKLDNFFALLDEILSNYIKINKLSIVLDNKNVVIADKSLDITNEILNLINKKINYE